MPTAEGGLGEMGLRTKIPCAMWAKAQKLSRDLKDQRWAKIVCYKSLRLTVIQYENMVNFLAQQ